MANIQALKSNVLFKDFGDDELAAVAGYVEEKSMPAGSPLFLENMKGESMYIVIAGSIALSKMLSEGETKTLTTMGPGDFFGEMALIQAGPRPVSAIVGQDAQLLVIKRTGFEALMQQSPQLAVKIVMGMYRYIADQVRESSPRIQAILMGQ